MIGHHVRRLLAVALTPDEVRERLEKAAVLVGEIGEREEAQKAEAKAAKDRIASMGVELSQLAREARDREALRDVQCVWEADYGRAVATLIRTDTGEAIETRGLTTEEMQVQIPAPVMSSDDLVESTDARVSPPSPRRRRTQDTEA